MMINKFCYTIHFHSMLLPSEVYYHSLTFLGKSNLNLHILSEVKGDSNTSYLISLFQLAQ